MLWAVKTSRAAVPRGPRKAIERLPDVIGVGLDEAGMLAPVADVGDLGRRLLRRSRPERGARLIADVLAILQASRVAALRRGQDADGAPDAGARHLRERVGQIRMPVAHPDVHRERQAARDQQGLQRF